MEHLDRIAESYAGALGDSLMEKSRRRIDWICGKVSGSSVLDIGCSQGISGIILGRRGVRVTGIDVAEESIAYARSSLERESAAVQQCVTYVCADFFTEEIPAESYDAVLMTEVLEHLEHPDRMVEKALDCLREGGEVIVTVPFGINDFPDHKHTFYLADIYEMLAPRVVVETIEFMGGWIGFYGRKSSRASALEQIDLKLLREEEQAFFALERPLQDQVTVLAEKYKKTEENYQTMKATVQTRNEQLAAAQGKTEDIQKKLDTAVQETAQCRQQAQERQKRLEEQVEMVTAKYKKAEENYQVMKSTVQTRNEQLDEAKKKLETAERDKVEIRKRGEERCEMLETARKNELETLSKAKDEAMKIAIDGIYRESAAALEQWKAVETERYRVLEESHRQVLSESRQAYEMLGREHTETKAKLEAAGWENQTLRSANEQLMSRLEEAAQKQETLNRTCEQTKAALEAVSWEREELGRECERVRAEAEHAAARCSELERLSGELRARVQTGEQQNTQLRLKVQTCEQDITQLRTQAQIGKQKLLLSEQRCEELTKTLAERETRAAQLTAQLLRDAEELEKEERLLAAVKQQILQMNSQLQQARQQNRIYEEKLNKVYGTWYGRIALRCYKILRRIKHLLTGKKG